MIILENGNFRPKMKILGNLSKLSLKNNKSLHLLFNMNVLFYSFLNILFFCVKLNDHLMDHMGLDRF